MNLLSANIILCGSYVIVFHSVYMPPWKVEAKTRNSVEKQNIGKNTIVENNCVHLQRKCDNDHIRCYTCL